MIQTTVCPHDLKLHCCHAGKICVTRNFLARLHVNSMDQSQSSLEVVFILKMHSNLNHKRGHNFKLHSIETKDSLMSISQHESCSVIELLCKKTRLKTPFHS